MRGRSPVTLEAKAARPHSEAGDAFFGQKDYENAIREYTRAIELDDEPADRYARRGNVYFAMEASDKALADYRKAGYQDRAAVCEEKIT
jgi:tetratricopeptide (TPR) repeat protein